MKRGDLVTIAVSGSYGKPRPALVVQAGEFDTHPSVVLLPLTSEIHDTPLFRVSVGRGRQTGLRVLSQIMVDKITTVPRGKVGAKIGRIHPDKLIEVDRALRGFLSL